MREFNSTSQSTETRNSANVCCVCGKTYEGYDAPIAYVEEQEYDTLGTGDIEMFNAYMKEKVNEEFESLVDALRDSADEFSDREVSCEFNYEFDYEQEWLDYITNMDDKNVTSEYALNFYKENIECFINADDMQEYIYSIEVGCCAWTENHGCECCDVYVENPYYVAEVNDAPVHNIVDFVYGLDLKPEWCELIDVRNSEYGDYLLITLYGSHTIGLCYEDEYFDHIISESSWSRADMEYALEIMENRDKILALARFENKNNN